MMVLVDGSNARKLFAFIHSSRNFVQELTSDLVRGRVELLRCARERYNEHWREDADEMQIDFPMASKPRLLGNEWPQVAPSH
jgi:hypothetical protein